MTGPMFRDRYAYVVDRNAVPDGEARSFRFHNLAGVERMGCVEAWRIDAQAKRLALRPYSTDIVLRMADPVDPRTLRELGATPVIRMGAGWHVLPRDMWDSPIHAWCEMLRGKGLVLDLAQGYMTLGQYRLWRQEEDERLMALARGRARA